MKRSEMCKIIADFVNQIYTVQNIESIEEIHLASMLLSEIELEGSMKPIKEISQNQDNITILFGWESEFKSPCVEKLKKTKETLKHIHERKPE